jgi:adenine specific DNA methylase Mod
LSKTGQKYFKTYYNFIETKNNDGATEIHKATYSTDFVKYFIDLYSFPGSIVLDNFMGTGTSAIGCIDLDRNYIGIDMCQEYVDYTNDRISKHVKDSSSIHTPKPVDKIKDNSGGKKTIKKEKIEVKESVEDGLKVEEDVPKQVKIDIKNTEDDFWG